MPRLRASVALLFALNAFAQQRTVAITVDDLPSAKPEKLLDAFQSRDIPVTGFVIQKHVEALGIEAGTATLRGWVRRGFDLGNHTYSHPDINTLTVEQIEEEIVRGEKAFVPVMKEAGKTPQFFRFPMNHTGETQAKHDALAAFLKGRGYRLAVCTIDTSDYLFNGAYSRMLANNDRNSAEKLRQEYVVYSAAEIDYYAALNKQVLGYEPPEVMLLHDNVLNADVIDKILDLFEKKQYRFVSLTTALSDAAYQRTDAHVSAFGPMWGYRWAKERKIKVNGALEPEPPQWILDYGKRK